MKEKDQIKAGSSGSPPSSGAERPVWVRYGLAIAIIAVAVVARMWLQPLLQDRAPFITLFPAVAMVVFLAGAGPGILAIFLASVAAYWLFIPPETAIAAQGFNALTWLFIFLMT